MGLYDSFILTDVFKCPMCGTAYPKTEFQTKDLGECFETIRQGEKAIFNDCLILQDGEYPVYTSCKNCRAWITANAQIENNIFVGINNIVGEKYNPITNAKEEAWDARTKDR